MAKESKGSGLDYEALGVEPPSVDAHGVDSPETPISTFIQQTAGNHTHRWKAIGNYLECDAGHTVHGVPYDHLNKVLAGTDSAGQPILRDITIQTKADQRRLTKKSK